MDKQVGIIILNYNNWEDTINCIDSIEGYNSYPIKYFVVDNGSTREGCLASLRSSLGKRFGDEFIIMKEGDTIPPRFPKCILLGSSINDGYAKGNNKGLELIYKDDEITHILILNNDIIFVEDILPALINAKEGLKDSAFVSPLLYKKDGKSIDYNCARQNYTNWNLILTYLMMHRNMFGYIARYSKRILMLKDNPQLIVQPSLPIELPSGSCMFISKDELKQLEGFDSNTFLYFEENILFKKVQKKGWQNYLIPSLHCIHLGAQSSKETANWFILASYFRSSIYYLENYGDLTFLQNVCLKLCKWCFPIKIYIMKMTR